MNQQIERDKDLTAAATEADREMAQTVFNRRLAVTVTATIVIISIGIWHIMRR